MAIFDPTEFQKTVDRFFKASMGVHGHLMAEAEQHAQSSGEKANAIADTVDASIGVGEELSSTQQSALFAAQLMGIEAQLASVEAAIHRSTMAILTAGSAWLAMHNVAKETEVDWEALVRPPGEPEKPN